MKTTIEIVKKKRHFPAGLEPGASAGRPGLVTNTPKQLNKNSISQYEANSYSNKNEWYNHRGSPCISTQYIIKSYQ